MKKAKNSQKKNIKKAQKQKKRQEKIKKQAQQISSADIEDLVDSALACVERGDMKKGEKILLKLKPKHDKNELVQYGLGTIALSKDENKKAIQLFKKTVEINPDFLEAHFNLGLACQRETEIPALVTSFRRVLDLDKPGSPTFSYAEDTLKYLEEELQKNNGISLDDFMSGYHTFEQGVRHMESGDWDAAIISFHDALKISPKHTQSYGNLGICYAKMKKKQEALNAFEKALELDPNYEPALINRKLVLALEDDESLPGEPASIDYYRDHSPEK